MRFFRWIVEWFKRKFGNIPFAEIQKEFQKKYTEETILSSVRVYKTRSYGGSMWDSKYNTFFQTWFFITDKRIVVARNTMPLKIFASIPFSDISSIEYAPEILEIQAKGISYNIEFFDDPLFEKLQKEIDSLIEKNSALSEAYPYCTYCKEFSPKRSRFCLECGKEVTLKKI